MHRQVEVPVAALPAAAIRAPADPAVAKVSPTHRTWHGPESRAAVVTDVTTRLVDVTDPSHHPLVECGR